MGLLPDGKKKSEVEKGTGKAAGDDRIVDKEWAATDWTWRRALKTYQFWAFFVLLLGTGWSFNGFLSHFVAMMIDIGHTAEFAAGLLLIYAATSMLGRIGGSISDIIGREFASTLCASIMLFSLIFLLIAWDTPTPWMLYVFIVLFGFGGGMNSPSFAAGAADLFQGRRFGGIFGLANMGFGIGSSLGTWLNGFIYDTTGSYKLAVVITMLSICLTVGSMWVAAPRKVRKVSGWRRSKA